MEKHIFAIFVIFLFLLFIKNNDTNIIKLDIFSRFKPTINDVIVVAILLPKIMPILWLKVNAFILINVIVIIMIAELDCINAVEINPVSILECKEDVNLDSFSLIDVKENFNRSLLNKSIE